MSRIPLRQIPEEFERDGHVFQSKSDRAEKRVFAIGRLLRDARYEFGQISHDVVGGPLVWPPAAHAQQPDRVRRIGVLFATLKWTEIQVL